MKQVVIIESLKNSEDFQNRINDAITKNRLDVVDIKFISTQMEDCDYFGKQQAMIIYNAKV